MSVSYLDRQTLAAIAPTVREALHVSHERFGWLTSAFALAYLTFSPISGWLVDRVGARRVLAIAVLLWSAVAALHATATSFLGLVVLRIALGAFESPSFPSAVRTIRSVLPPSQRSSGFGLLFTGSSFGAMIAAPLAVRITKDHGFRYAFVVTAIVGLAWLPLWLFFTRPSFTGKPAEEPTQDEPANVLGALLRHPAVQRQAIIVAASAPAISFVLSWYAQFLVEATGVSKDDVGHFLWLPPLMFDVAAVAFGIAASARDKRHPGGSHGGLMIVAALLTSTLAVAPLVDGPWARVIIGGLSMAGGGGMYVIGTADMMRRVSSGSVAAAGGVSAAVQSIVQIISAPLVGMVIDRTHAWWSVLVSLGLLAIPGGIFWVLLPPPLELEPEVAPISLR